jgi:hypothetical protein
MMSDAPRGATHGPLLVNATAMMMPKIQNNWVKIKSHAENEDRGYQKYNKIKG